MKLELLFASIRAREPAIHMEHWQLGKSKVTRHIPSARVQMAAQCLHDIRQYLEIAADFSLREYQTLHITTWTHTLYVLILARKLIFLDSISPANLLLPVSTEATETYTGTGWDPVLAAEESGIRTSGAKLLKGVAAPEIAQSRIQYLGVIMRYQLEGYRQRAEMLRRSREDGGDGDVAVAAPADHEAAERSSSAPAPASGAVSRAAGGERDGNSSTGPEPVAALSQTGFPVVGNELDGNEASGMAWAEPSFDELVDWLSGQDMVFWSGPAHETMPML
jgi:hypothetical protein